MDKYAVRDYYGGFSIMKITKILGAASAAVVSAAVMAASDKEQSGDMSR